MGISSLERISEVVWELAQTYKQGMRVPARIIGTQALVEKLDASVFDQIANVASLPGVFRHVFCMPDGHSGYGFPIGGVAAMDPRNGVISPGGIGFDINCGMRLVATSLTEAEVAPRIRDLVDRLYERVPAGTGGSGFLHLRENEFREIAENGARWCLRKGFASSEDLEVTEDGGCAAGADSSKVSIEAIQRGLRQVGTLGSGNHYLEIQVLRKENIFDQETAEQFGLFPGQIVIMFHCGSRGFGHQVASDYLKLFLKVMGPKYGISVDDRELACAPFQSPEGQDYFSAMKCAMNMAYANRQVILHRVREVLGEVFRREPSALGLCMVYDVAHNTAKLEELRIDGKATQLLVHRKGATRAFAPGSQDLPQRYRKTGQPVIIGGSMESGSYLLAGVAEGVETFFSTAHGSGRTMSRHQAKQSFNGKRLLHDMMERGTYVRSASLAGLAEEAGGAYKNIDEVVHATHLARISRPVAKFVPIGNIKG